MRWPNRSRPSARARPLRPPRCARSRAPAARCSCSSSRPPASATSFLIRRPATIRSSTPPCGPVFLSLPTDVLRGETTATIWDQAKFDVPMHIRPDPDDITKAARLLIEARNPLMSIGDEATWCRANKELVELAELIG